MWTYERFMLTLNRYILNRAYPEGSMIEAYTTKESINCCIRYIRDGRVIGLLVPQHEGRTSGRGCTGRKVRTNIPNEMVQEAHHSVLNELVLMEPYVERHVEEIHAAHEGKHTLAWVQKIAQDQFHDVDPRHPRQTSRRQ
jgi:hypothetical protein